MKHSWFNSRFIAGVLLALFFGIALYLRIVPPYDKVFVGDWIKFTGVDAYFFMRLVDNLIPNFPHLASFDPYFLYPAVSSASSQTLWPYLISGVAWLFGLGSPSQHTVDLVGVYFPAVLGALTTIPIYFIGKTLFNRWAGVIAAGLIAIFPGEFLGRSILGFTDYHVAEVLFTTVMMLFLILAIKASRDRQLTLSSLWHGQRAIVVKPLIYSLLCGVLLGIYFLTWAGALLFVFLIFAYFVIQFIIDHIKSRSTEYLAIVSTVVFLVAFLIFLPTSPISIALAAFAIAIIIPIIMAVVSYFMSKRNIRPAIYPAAVIGLGILSLLILRITNPSLLHSMTVRLNIFKWPIGTTVLEMQPLLYPGGSFSLQVAWGNFTTSFYLSLISLGILIYLVIKRGETEKTAFVVWSLVILAATLAMRRFAYYFAVNAALLTGYLSWLVLDISGFKKLMEKPVDKPLDISKKAKPRRAEYCISPGRITVMVTVVLVTFLVVFLPNIGPAINNASQAVFAPSNAWYESLTWLKDNTPEPFGSADFYYESYEKPTPGTNYTYPETTYGVTAWWDYGYWITRIGHRIPTSNPGTSTSEASFFTGQDEASADTVLDKLGSKYIMASFFTAQDESSADAVLDKFGSKYVIVDHDIATVIRGKFYALATLGGNDPDKFYGIYYQLNENTLEPVLLFYPEYYRTLVVRLYYFDGSKVIPNNVNVISYQDKVSQDGQPYKQITSVKSFADYQEAQTYIASQKSVNYRIVSPDPYSTPVPLPAVDRYKLVYSSKGTIITAGKISPEVKIFEFIK